MGTQADGPSIAVGVFYKNNAGHRIMFPTDCALCPFSVKLLFLF